MAVKIEIYWQDLEYPKIREILKAKGIVAGDVYDLEKLAGEHLDAPITSFEVEPVNDLTRTINGTT